METPGQTHSKSASAATSKFTPTDKNLLKSQVERELQTILNLMRNLCVENAKSLEEIVVRRSNMGAVATDSDTDQNGFRNELRFEALVETLR